MKSDATDRMSGDSPASTRYSSPFIWASTAATYCCGEKSKVTFYRDSSEDRLLNRRHCDRHLSQPAFRVTAILVSMHAIRSFHDLTKVAAPS